MSDIVERPVFRRRLNSTPAWIGHRAPDGVLGEVEPSETYRYDPAYFTYYNSLRPLDPRLPPPLFKSHFPNYEQPTVSGEYPEDLQIAPYCPKDLYVYTSVPVVGTEECHPLDTYVPPVAAEVQDEYSAEPNPVLSEMCEDVQTRSAGSIVGAGLLGFHLSRALTKEPETYTREMEGDEQPSYMGTEEYADEDLDTQSCPTTEALSLVSERSESKKTRANKINRIPQRLLPLIPSMDSGRVSWLMSPLPEACGTVQCSIWRDKKLLNSRYIMNLEMPPTPNVVADSFGREFLDGNVQKATQQFMIAGKRIGRGAYLLSADKDDFDKKGPNAVAKCRRNLTSHDFTILSARDAKKKKDKRGTTKKELAAVQFAPSSKNTPAQVQAILPVADEEAPADEWLLNQFNNGKCVNNTIIKNTQPIWNKKTKSYEIDFGGRVKMASVKNMQLQNIAADNKPVTLTFGKVEENHFVLDFAYPLSPVAAFGIALAAFDAL
eukprot:TRINITY_DN60142_c0_g2_i1.p1 TRINITY_DN60142_c0_g2~~TRINITY_DN60142_c0_g2_i1.p1  ORF type:complete len:492 (+),score=37.07 TRINITY_DN60142_c0_g2_i1:78-1553(+)